MLWALVLFFALPSAAESAHAFRLQADDAARALEFERVQTLAEAGLASGDANSEDTRALYALLAQAQAVVNQAAGSVRSFGILLELDPGFTLPVGTSPKVAAPLEAARGSTRGQHLALRSRTEAAADAALATEVHWSGDAYGVVRGARIQYEAQGGTHVEGLTLAEGNGRAAWRCTLSPCAFGIELLDAAGNVLLAEAHPDIPRLTARVSEPGPKPLLRRPLIYWLGAGVLALGGATAAVFYGTSQHEVLALRADRAHHGFSEYVDASARRNAAGAATLSCFGAGVGLGALGFAF